MSPPVSPTRIVMTIIHHCDMIRKWQYPALRYLCHCAAWVFRRFMLRATSSCTSCAALLALQAKAPSQVTGPLCADMVIPITALLQWIAPWAQPMVLPSHSAGAILSVMTSQPYRTTDIKSLHTNGLRTSPPSSKDGLCHCARRLPVFVPSNLMSRIALRRMAQPAQLFASRGAHDRSRAMY